MTILDDLFDMDLYASMVREGYVREQTHPTLPLVIAKYTEKASYDREWNPVTLQCRGLVFDTRTYKVVVRCMPKFFNHDEAYAPDLSGHEVEVFDKLDGSLIQAALYNGELVVTSSGSFTSEHAFLAKSIFDADPEALYAIPDWTYVFELVSPMNRIVVDYGGVTQLRCLTQINNISGHEIPALYWEKFPPVERFPYTSLTEALSAPPRPNAEGYVIRSVQTGERVKIKQEDYIRLHRIVTGVTPLRIWEVLSAGQDFSQWLEGVPDEFYKWVQRQVAQFMQQYNDLQQNVLRAYQQIVSQNEINSRKDFAVAVQKGRGDMASALFMLYDDRDISSWIWKQLKPRGDAVFVKDDE